MDEPIEGRVLSWNATAHVMRSAVSSKLTPELQNANETEDLNLRGSWQRIPLIWRASSCCNVAEGNVTRQLPRENDVIRLQTKANESRHRNAAVLELSMPQEPNRGIITLTPELRRA